MKCNFGFSLFRIMAGITMLVAGYDKIFNIIKIKFNPADYGILQWFLGAFHGEKSTMASHVQIFFPKFSIYILSYILPFWEFAIGFLIVFGFYRKIGAYLGIILMAVFLAGTQGAMMGALSIVEMVVLGITYFIVYLGVENNLDDPLAIDTYLKK